MRTRILLCAVLLLAGCVADGPKTKQYSVGTDAMQPKLRANQPFTAKVVKAGTYKPTPGDVVVFRNPEKWGPGDDKSVKRVIAVEGFVIACCDVNGRVTVDGVGLDEPYLGENASLDVSPEAGKCASRRFGPVTVEAGHVFVMGDSRAVSVDSRCLGTVPNANVIGVVE
ncbi:signal peptidase I [Dactylosporangium cerinum]|uniref:Signal peptidase I n=1 Tax=Dactylosporangium cerinum TaxID=1434730 RepID=A0ABV9W6U4_9ACTN